MIVFLRGVWSTGSEFREWTGPNTGSEYGFGVQRKDLALHWFNRFGERTRPTPGSLGLEFEERNGPNPGFADFEFREKTGPNPGLVGSEFRERNGPNPGWAGSEFGEKTCPKSGLEFGFREKTWLIPDSEFGFGDLRKERAEPWFSRFRVRERTFFSFF